MQDTIIKSSGNSRTLASVPKFLTLYPTYEDFAQALINRELPIDLGPLNPAGLQQQGTDLNKETLLKDSTAALYGKPATAVPDDILAAIKPLITTAQNTANKRCQIQSGVYTGTGTGGAGNPNSLSFLFSPIFVAFIGVKYTQNGQRPDGTTGSVDLLGNLSANGRFLIDMADLTTAYMQEGPSTVADLGSYRELHSWAKKSSDGKTLTWYTEIIDKRTGSLIDDESNFVYQLNAKNFKYRYVAIA